MAKHKKDEILENQETPVEQVTEETAEEQAPVEEKSDRELLIEKLEKENKELNEKVLRQYAEFDNYKKRTAREKDSLYDYAKGDTVAKIFSVLDIFEQALKTQTADEAFYKGVVMIYDRFKAILKDLGVEEIEGVGAAFDPNVHNAVQMVENGEFGENTVCQVYQTGYKMKDKVLRPAMVVVANP